MYVVNMHGMFYQKTKKILRLTVNFLDKSDCKSNKIWVDQASEFYNKSMKSWQ